MSSKSAIDEAIRFFLERAIDKISGSYSDEEITDFYIHFDSETNELTMVDDNDVRLSKATLVSEDEDGDMDSMKKQIRDSLRSSLSEMNKSKIFDGFNIFRPFSFVYEDDDTMDDLLIVDDSNIIIGEELMKDLDEDLDSFFEKLMK
jgi:hypothetical protein